MINMNYFKSLIISLLLFPTFIFSIEDSIIPLMEKYLIAENLPQHKYAKRQLNEITEALKSKEGKIRLASYNMLFDIFDNGLEDDHKWPNRLPRIVDIIEDMNADIIGVQEPYPHQMEQLLSKIDTEYAHFSRQVNQAELNGVLYRKDRFELVESEIWDMEEAAGKTKSSNVLTMVKLRDKKTDKVIAVFNTHLCYGNIQIRENQIDFIIDKLEDYAKTSPVIFMGDLNTFPQRLDREYQPFHDGDYINRLLTKGSLKNARDVSLLGHLGPMSTYNNSEKSAFPFKGNGVPGVFLDNIYTSQEINVLVHATQPAKVGGKFASDHFPVIIDFVIN